MNEWKEDWTNKIKNENKGNEWLKICNEWMETNKWMN